MMDIEMKRIITAVFMVITVMACGKDYNAVDFGAKNDGISLNTEAIQKAIDKCFADGGGRVVFSPGKYVTGTIWLKDNVEFHVAAGVVVLGSENTDHYSEVHKHMYKNEKHMDRVLIYAEDARCFSVTGQGTIDGQGERDVFPNKDKKERYRPMLMRFVRCENIRMRDITLIRPAAWVSAWLYCNDIVVDGITIHSRSHGNGDGLDFDGCENVRVSNCSFNTSDDSICLQASRKDTPCKNVVITNCFFHSRCASIRIGLLSRGDIENVTMNNCVFEDNGDSGFKIQECEGGKLFNMSFSNIVMKNVPRPIFITFCQQTACVDAPEEMAPMNRMGNIVFSDFMVDNSGLDKNSMFIISGLPGYPIENIRLSNIQFVSAGGGAKVDGEQMSMPEFTLENIGFWWPEYYSLKGTVPAYGLYARHVKGLVIEGMNISNANSDSRPAIICDDVSDITLSSIKMQGNKDADAMIRLQNSADVLIYNSYVLGSYNKLVGSVDSKSVRVIGLAD